MTKVQHFLASPLLRPDSSSTQCLTSLKITTQYPRTLRACFLRVLAPLIFSPASNQILPHICLSGVQVQCGWLVDLITGVKGGGWWTWPWQTIKRGTGGCCPSSYINAPWIIHHWTQSGTLKIRYRIDWKLKLLGLWIAFNFPQECNPYVLSHLTKLVLDEKYISFEKGTLLYKH